MESRFWLYSRSEQYAGEGRDILVLGQHIASLSDAELESLAAIEREQYDRNAIVTTNMAIYCNAVRAEINRRKGEAIE